MLKRWWRISGSEPKAENEILVGNNVASKLDLKPGSIVTLKREEFKVVGTLGETGAQEDSLVFVQLPVAQRLLGKPGLLSLIEVSALCRNCPIDEIVEQVKTAIPDAKVAAVLQAVKTREETITRFTNFTAAISLAVLIIGGLIVLTTMMSSVNKRTREIGIFRATGFRRSHVMKIIFIESLVLSVLAGSFGWLAGMLLSMALGPKIANISVGVFEWNPLVAIGAILLSTTVGFLGALYPAIKAATLDPAEALRFI